MAASIAAIASSISLPMVGCLALACRCDQRASFGTQKTFSARYSSGSSAAAASSASSAARFASKALRDVLEEDQAERDVLVVGRLKVLAQLVGGKEQLRLEAEIGTVAVCLCGFCRLRGYCARSILFRSSFRHGHFLALVCNSFGPTLANTQT